MAHHVGLVLLFYFGLCEVLATTQAIDWNRVPDILAWMFLPLGYIGIFLLLGVFGQVLLAGLTFFATWRRLGWPLWRAALFSAPFWLAPKPW